MITPALRDHRKSKFRLRHGIKPRIKLIEIFMPCRSPNFDFDEPAEEKQSQRPGFGFSPARVLLVFANISIENSIVKGY